MDDVLKLIGLIYRAKKLVLGEEVLNNLPKIKLMIIAKDISIKSRQRYEKKCDYYNIKHIDSIDGKELSKCIGKDNVKVIGIIDEGFKQALLKKI